MYDWLHFHIYLRFLALRLLRKKNIRDIVIRTSRDYLGTRKMQIKGRYDGR